MATALVHAHEGHGLPGMHHWHATDVLGFVLAAAVGVGLVLVDAPQVTARLRQS